MIKSQNNRLKVNFKSSVWPGELAYACNSSNFIVGNRKTMFLAYSKEIVSETLSQNSKPREVVHAGGGGRCMSI
jgi:hypothetical protein